MSYFLLVIKALFSRNHTTDSLDSVKERLTSKPGTVPLALMFDLDDGKRME